MKKLWAVLLCGVMIITLPLLATGCKKKEDTPAGKLIRYYLDAEPLNLDPQLSSDYASIMVVQNIFEGLVRLDKEGVPEPGAAVRWESNDAHTVFTFYLRQNAAWSDGTPLTAHDFVYGIRRGVMKETASPSFDSLACIKNAEAIHNGDADISTLGVTATDTFTLVIELESSFSDFPAQTAKPPYMPCNETFFHETGGKYGLEAQFVLSNGPFALREKNGWSHDKYVRLVTNKHYAGNTSPLPSGILFTITAQPEDTVGALTAEEPILDAAPLQAEQLAEAKENGLSVTQFTDTTWGLCVNTSTQLFSILPIRQAFFQSINRSTALAVLPPNSTLSSSIVPLQATLLGKSYRSLAGELQPVYTNPADTKNMLKSGLAALGLQDLPTVTLLCLNDIESKTLANNLVASWKEGIGYYLRITPVSRKELLQRVQAGNYQLAIYPVEATSEDPTDFLANFSSAADNNPAKFSSDVYDSLLNQAEENHDNALESLKAAEQLLLDQGVFYPLYSESRYYVMGPTVTGIIFRPFHGGVDFIHAGRTEKKMVSSSQSLPSGEK